MTDGDFERVVYIRDVKAYDRLKQNRAALLMVFGSAVTSWIHAFFSDSEIGMYLGFALAIGCIVWLANVRDAIKDVVEEEEYV